MLLPAETATHYTTLHPAQLKALTTTADIAVDYGIAVWGERPALVERLNAGIQALQERGDIAGIID